MALQFLFGIIFPLMLLYDVVSTEKKFMRPYEKWREGDLKGDARGIYFPVSYCFILLLSNLNICTRRLPEILIDGGLFCSFLQFPCATTDIKWNSGRMHVLRCAILDTVLYYSYFATVFINGYLNCTNCKMK